MIVTGHRTAVVAKRGAVLVLVCAISLALWIAVVLVLVGPFSGPGD